MLSSYFLYILFIFKNKNYSELWLGQTRSKMDKSQLEQGLSKLNQMLSTEDKEKIIKEFQNGNH